MQTRCHYCGKKVKVRDADFKRALKGRYHLYCNRRCAGFGRRTNKSKNQLVKEKSVYDKWYRNKNYKRIKKRKAEYFKQTYNPTEAAVIRKKNMQRHVEYCRRPEYKKWKQQYDKNYRAKKLYGEFADAAKVLFELQGIVDNRQAKAEQNNILKSQKRKRQWKSLLLKI